MRWHKGWREMHTACRSRKGRNRKSGSHMIKCFVTEFQYLARCENVWLFLVMTYFCLVNWHVIKWSKIFPCVALPLS